MTNGFNIEALIDGLAEKVAEKVEARLGRQDGGIRPRLLTIEQAAEYLGRTKTAVQHMVAEGGLPVVRSDRRVFLDVRDLDVWIDRHKQEM